MVLLSSALVIVEDFIRCSDEAEPVLATLLLMRKPVVNIRRGIMSQKMYLDSNAIPFNLDANGITFKDKVDKSPINDLEVLT